MRDERSAGGLRMQLQPLCPIIRLEHIAHPDRPDLPADPCQREIFDVQPAIQEE
jgi:hypothetical protein